MQVFVPYNDILQIVKDMSSDKRRYNKQIVECNQIIRAIKGETEAWKNHPICHQYKNYKDWLEWYQLIFEIYRKNDYQIIGYYDIGYYLSLQPLLPPFLKNEDYLNSHKRRLYQKSPELYPQFEKYNNENDKSNWYCVPRDFNIPKRKTVSILGMEIHDKNTLFTFIKYE